MNLESELQKQETIGLLCSVTGFPGVTVVKTLPASVGHARDMGLICGLGKSPGVGNGNPLQCSSWDNPMQPSGLQSVGSLRVARKTRTIFLPYYLPNAESD